MVADKIYDLLPSSLPRVVGELPGTKSNVVAIMEYPGGASTEFFGMPPSILKPIVKIVIRHQDYAAGQTWVDTVKQALNKHHDEFFMSIHMVDSPGYLGRGESELHEFQITFITTVKE